MNIVLGATGRVGSCVVEALLAHGQPVRAVVRDEEKAARLRERGVEAAVVDCFDSGALASALRGGSAVLFLTPENPRSEDVLGDAARLLKSCRDAAMDSGIGRIVGLSSSGAQHAAGTGNLVVSHMLEHAFDDLKVEKAFVRPAYYYSNWMGCWDVAKNDGILPTFFPPDLKVSMIAPSDVGAFLADVMAGKREPRRPVEIYEIAGPEPYSSDDIAGAFGRVFGKTVTAVQIPRDDWPATFRQIGFSESVAENFALMTDAVISGKTRTEFDALRLPTGFEDYLRRFLDDLPYRNAAR